MIVVLDEFNAKSNNLCKADITSFEGSMIDIIASSYCLNQLIQEATNIPNSSSACIELIITCEPNLVMESGIHSLLGSNCHHQIVSTKFNFSIFYPPSYERTLWYYVRVNTKPISKAIDQFDWLSALSMSMLIKKVDFFSQDAAKYNAKFHST